MKRVRVNRARQVAAAAAMVAVVAIDAAMVAADNAEAVNRLD